MLSAVQPWCKDGSTHGTRAEHGTAGRRQPYPVGSGMESSVLEARLYLLSLLHGFCSVFESFVWFRLASSLMYSRGGLEPWSTEVAGVRHHTDVAKAFVDEREKLIFNVHQTTSLHQKRSLHCLGLYFGTTSRERSVLPQARLGISLWKASHGYTARS